MTLFNKLFFFILLLFFFTCSSRAGFTCKTTKTSTCKSLAGYVSPNATTLSDIAARFGLLMDFDSLLGANSLPLDTPPDKVVDAKETIIIPFTCTCNNGTGVSDKSPVYKVLPGDFLYHIATDIFGLLITTDEIAVVNNISNPELIEVDQLLWIPIPCSCDNVDGNQVVHYAYVVPPSRSLDMVAKKFGVTAESLSKINEIADGEELEAEVVLDVPLRACTSTVDDASPDYPLLASNGSYIFTANNCVKCTCNSNNKNWTLHCEPSPPEVKVQNWQQCPLVQCPGGRGVASNYALGQLSYLDNSTCNGTNCAYTGYNNLSGTISASLHNVNTCLEGIPSPPSLLPSPSNPPPASSNKKGKNSSILVIGIVVPSTGLVLLTISFWLFCLRRKKVHEDTNNEILVEEFVHFDFVTISAATNNFSQANKLGEGGFGAVYKGTLSNMQEVAVKRLSKNSNQGDQEFKNEVTLLAKLQHINLVRLLGFCLAGEEKLLIYEFVPNASLDKILFDPIKCAYLDWERRYNIIGGIARGLLYLHEESRLKIIHRDLKASNILLDKDMNPKIADFGAARLFELDQTRDSTNRIVGTYGYMAPEYRMHGQFSVKSDVFSFGVLVLEILCGQKNSYHRKSETAQNLLSYAWRQWKNGYALEALDPTLKDTCSNSEAMRCILIGLLCVQDNVADRPTMQTVFLMLNCGYVSHELPSEPAFFAASTRHTELTPTLYQGHSEQGISKDRSTTELATRNINEFSVIQDRPWRSATWAPAKRIASGHAA